MFLAQHPTVESDFVVGTQKNDAAPGSALLRLEIRILGILYLLQNTTLEMDEITPGFFFHFHFARNTPNEFANRDVLTHVLE